MFNTREGINKFLHVKKFYETDVSVSTNSWQILEKFKKGETNEKQFKRYVNQGQCMDFVLNTLSDVLYKPHCDHKTKPRADAENIKKGESEHTIVENQFTKIGRKRKKK